MLLNNFFFTLYNALTHPSEHLSQPEKPKLCNHPAASELIVGIIKNKKSILNKGGSIKNVNPGWCMKDT